MIRALEVCGNPGRSGHWASRRAADEVYRCRAAAAELFGVQDLQRVVFTCNATHSLNIAIKSCLRDGGHAVISGYEHNSVVRPLESMARQGVTYTVAASALYHQEAVVPALESCIRPDTRCVIVTHVSNVFGYVLPLAEIDSLCLKHDIHLIIDASQSAGVLPLDVSKLSSAAFVCMPGHKGLYGPQGTGLLLCCKEMELYTIAEGGTGSQSKDMVQPDFLPDMLESGTLNVPGIAGLGEGIRFVLAHRAEIGDLEGALADRAAADLRAIPGFTVWRQPGYAGGVLSFRCADSSPEVLAGELADRGFCLRSGLHCAPLAHRSAGTMPQGTVRASFSAFNTERDIRQLVCAAEKMRKT